MANISLTVTLRWTLAAVCIVAIGDEALPAATLQSSRVIKVGGDNLDEKAPVVSGVALDGQGKLLAVAGDDHLVRVIRLEDGRQLYELPAHTDWIRVVAFRPDGKMLATAGDDRRIRSWSVGRDARPLTLPAHRQVVYTLAYSPDGRMLATAGFEREVRVYDGDDGRMLRVFQAPIADVRAVVFSPDGTRLAAAGGGGKIRIWDVVTGKVVVDIEGHGRRTNTLAYSPDGRLLASAGCKRTVCLWDSQSGRSLGHLPERPCKVMGLTFCGNTTLAAGGSDNVIYLWDITAREQRAKLEGHTGSVSSLVFHPQTRELISGSFDTTVRVWNLADQLEREVSLPLESTTSTTRTR